MTKAPRTLVWLTLAILTNCTHQHEGPEASDTVTNWLRHCTSHGDCTGAAWCFNELCTLPCDGSRAHLCGQAQAGLVCDMDHGMCDFPCARERDCDVLGTNYACEAGHCRASVDLMSDASEPSFSSDPTDQIPEVEGVGGALTAREYGTLPTPRGSKFQLNQRDTSGGAINAVWTGTHFRVTWREGEGLSDGLGVAEVSPTDSFTTRSFDLPSAGRLVQGPGTALLLGTESGSGALLKCFVRTLDLDAQRSGFLLTFPCNGRLMAAPTRYRDEWALSWSRGWPTPGEAMVPIAVARYRSNSGSWVDGPRALGTPWSTTGPDALVVVGSDVWLYASSDTVSKIGGFTPSSRPDEPRTDAFTASEYETVTLPSDNLYPNGAIWPRADGVVAVFHHSDTTLQVVPIESDGTTLGPIYLDAATPYPSVASLSGRDAFALCLMGPSGVSVTVVSNSGQVIGEPIVVDHDPDVLLCDLAWSGSELLVVWRQVANDAMGLADVMAKIVAVP